MCLKPRLVLLREMCCVRHQCVLLFCSNFEYFPTFLRYRFAGAEGSNDLPPPLLLFLSLVPYNIIMRHELFITLRFPLDPFSLRAKGLERRFRLRVFVRDARIRRKRHIPMTTHARTRLEHGTICPPFGVKQKKKKIVRLGVAYHVGFALVPRGQNHPIGETTQIGNDTVAAEEPPNKHETVVMVGGWKIRQP